MVSQNHEKVVFSFYMKLPKLHKYKDLLGFPTTIKDACGGQGQGVGGAERGGGIPNTPGPARLAAFWGDDDSELYLGVDGGNKSTLCKVEEALLFLIESVWQFPRNNRFGCKLGGGGEGRVSINIT